MTEGRSHVASNRVWSPVGYARAVRVGPVIEVSGTTSATAGGEVLHPGDLYGQTVAALQTIRAAIEDLGGSLSDVIRTRVFVTDIDRWEEAGRAHGEVFGEILPASSFVEISRLLHPDMLIEIEASAYVR